MLYFIFQDVYHFEIYQEKNPRVEGTLAVNSSKLVTKMIRHHNFSLQSVAEPSTCGVVPIHSGQGSCSLESTSNT